MSFASKREEETRAFGRCFVASPEIEWDSPCPACLPSNLDRWHELPFVRDLSPSRDVSCSLFDPSNRPGFVGRRKTERVFSLSKLPLLGFLLVRVRVGKPFRSKPQPPFSFPTGLGGMGTDRSDGIDDPDPVLVERHRPRNGSDRNPFSIPSDHRTKGRTIRPSHAEGVAEVEARDPFEIVPALLGVHVPSSSKGRNQG